MTLVLDTVQAYVDQARQLLQDLVVPYRYSDKTLVDALNVAAAEMVRLRPDLAFKLMRSQAYPFFVPTNMTAVVSIDYRYRPAVLLYIVAQAQLADQEDTSDAHVAALLQAFTAKLMTLQA